MPKLKDENQYAKQDKLLQATVNKYLILRDKTLADVGTSLGLKRATIYRNIQYPNTLTIERLRDIVDVLGIPKNEVDEWII